MKGNASGEELSSDDEKSDGGDNEIGSDVDDEKGLDGGETNKDEDSDEKESDNGLGGGEDGVGDEASVGLKDP